MAEPIATVKQGQLKGLTDIDLNGETYYKFLGIPYAKPPIGPLRFKAPQPAESWTGVRDATKDGSPNLHLDIFLKKIIGSEDCLFLNVFTKELPKAGLSPKPVMVFIHGGAFTVGSNLEQMLGGKYLVAEDIVLVSINYRVGIFGFLSSDDLSLDIPGNAGLKDQTFALKWVQDNISSFNGDPNNVTIFGVSAGGAAVHFQVLSATSEGLFHKAIAQSGSALNPWAWGQKNVIQVAQKLEEKVSNEKDAFDILMNVSADELYAAVLKIPDVIFNAAKRRPFGPVIEKPNPTAFLTENPTDLLASGKFNQVPLIQGVTSNEGLLVEGGQDKLLQFCDDYKETGVLWSFGVEKNSQKYTKLKAKINDFYFKNGETSEAIQKMVGDVGFSIGTIQSAKLAAKTSQSPVYLFIFSYETELSDRFLTFMGIERKNCKGVSHGADQMMLFNNDMGAVFGVPNAPNPELLEENRIGIKKVTKIWTDFARTGQAHALWEPITDVNKLNYFDISKDSKLKVNPFAERVAMWEDILKEVPINARFQEKPTL